MIDTLRSCMPGSWQVFLRNTSLVDRQVDDYTLVDLMRAKLKILVVQEVKDRWVLEEGLRKESSILTRVRREGQCLLTGVWARNGHLGV